MDDDYDPEYCRSDLYDDDEYDDGDGRPDSPDDGDDDWYDDEPTGHHQEEPNWDDYDPQPEPTDVTGLIPGDVLYDPAAETHRRVLHTARAYNEHGAPGRTVWTDGVCDENPGAGTPDGPDPRRTVTRRFVPDRLPVLLAYRAPVSVHLGVWTRLARQVEPVTGGTGHIYLDLDDPATLTVTARPRLADPSDPAATATDHHHVTLDIHTGDLEPVLTWLASAEADHRTTAPLLSFAAWYETTPPHLRPDPDAARTWDHFTLTVPAPAEVSAYSASLTSPRTAIVRLSWMLPGGPPAPAGPFVSGPGAEPPAFVTAQPRHALACWPPF